MSTPQEQIPDFSRFSTTAPQEKIPDLSRFAAPQEDQGVGHLLGNFFNHWAAYDMAVSLESGVHKEADFNNLDPETQSQIQAYRAAYRQNQADPNTGAAIHRTMMDMQNIIPSTAKGVWTGIKNLPGQLASGGLSGLASGLAEGVIRPFTDSFEAFDNVDLTSDTPRALTVNERVDRIKNVIATGTLLAVGGALHNVTNGLLDTTAAKAAQVANEGQTLYEGSRGLSTQTLEELRRSKLTMGQLGRNILANASTGALSGATYGLIHHANEDDQLTQTVLNGIQFGGLGAAMGLLGVRSNYKTTREFAEKAGEISRIRQSQDVYNNTIVDQVSQVQAFASSNDLLDAVVKGKLQVNPTQMIHIPGVTVEDATRLPKIVGKGAQVVLGPVDENGVADALVVGRNQVPKNNLAMFQKYGFMRDELVEYHGKDMIVRSIDDFTPRLEHPQTGARINAYDITDLTHKPNLTLMRDDPTLFGTKVVGAGGRVRTVFHGTPAEIEGELDPTRSSDKNLYGPGVYTTEDTDIAGGSSDRNVTGYANKAPPDATEAEIKQYYKPGTKLSNGDVVTDFKFEPQGRLGEFVATIQDPKTGRSVYIDTPPTHESLVAAGIRKGGPNVHMVRLNIRNPFDIDADFDISDKSDLTQKLLTSAKPVDQTSLMNNLQDLQNNADTNFIVEGEDLYSSLTESMYGDKTEVNKLLKAAGYDGITHIGGGRTGSGDHRVWIAFDKSQIKPPFNVMEPITKADAQYALDSSYARFKQRVKAAHANASPDQTGHPADIADVVPAPDFSFSKVFQDYVQKAGYHPDDVPALRAEFEKRMAVDLLRDLPDHERLVIEKLKNDATMDNVSRKVAGTRDIVRLARANGHYVTVEEAGKITLRDQNGDVVLRTKSLRDAADAIQKIGGAPQAIDLDVDSPVPPRGIAGDLAHMWDEPDPVPLPFQGRQMLDQIFAYLSASPGKWITGQVDIQKAVDRQWKTRFHAEVADKTQYARQISDAKSKPFLEKLRSGVDKHVRGMSSQDRENISHYLEADEPPANVAEKNLAQQLSPLDIDKLMEYRRQLSKITSSLTSDDPKFAERVAEARTALGMTDEHLRVNDLLDGLGDNGTIGGATRYARWIQNPVTKADLAKNMSAKQLLAANNLKSILDELGIAPHHILTHARLYYGGDILEAAKDFPNDKTNFNDSGGTLSAEDRDPISSTVRLIKVAHDNMHFNTTYNNAQDFIKEELKKIPEEGGSRAAVKEIMDRYMSDLKSWPGAGTQGAQAFFDKMLDNIGLKDKVDLNVRKDIVQFALSTTYSGALGLRLYAGIRDLSQGVMNYGSRLGTDRAAKFLKYGVMGLKGENFKTLGKNGNIPEAGLFGWSAPVEQARNELMNQAGKAGRFWEAYTNGIYKWTGIKNAYSAMYAGAYLEMYETAGNALLDFRDGKLTPREFTDKIGLHSFDQPVQIEFDRLVQQGGKDIEAVNYLARENVRETTAVYGNANYPRGWNTNTGKVLGQFGQYSTWYLQYLARVVSKGTLGQRAVALARLYAYTKAAQAAGKAVGLNLGSWGILQGLIPNFGGTLGASWGDIRDAVHGHGYTQKSAIRSLLDVLPITPDKIPGSGAQSEGILDDMMHGSYHFQLPHLWLPGSYGLEALAQSYDLAKRGFNPLMVGAKALGFPVDDHVRSWLDQATGNRPELR
jgi:hypothetical protein